MSTEYQMNLCWNAEWIAWRVRWRCSLSDVIEVLRRTNPRGGDFSLEDVAFYIEVI